MMIKFGLPAQNKQQLVFIFIGAVNNNKINEPTITHIFEFIDGNSITCLFLKHFFLFDPLETRFVF